ncbi:MAG: LysR family transcriptional regulator [Peptococcaceae bacterium]|nr:LysR family transcriptional regulator [Peptococcaceae bacterium]
MDSNQLKYIAYLTQTTSLTKVAEHFFTSHQVVKKAIAGLEDELQVTLVQSTNQGTQLTPAGQCVAGYMHRFQEQYDALQTELMAYRPVPGEDMTELHLYVTPNMATEYYLDLYDSFFENHNKINLVIHSSTFPQMLKESNTTKNNIYLTPISKTKEMEQLLAELLEKYQLTSILFPPVTNYLCMHKTSKYAKLTAPALSDLDNTPVYVFLNTNPLCLSDDDPGIGLQYFSDYAILKRNIKKNHAAGIIKKYEFDYYFGENNSEYILRPLKDTVIHHAVIISDKILDNNPIIHDFIHFLQNEFQN